jgi:UDP-MurNAc hydroxylase
MRITTLGHAGLHIETRHGTILCDPWTNPAFFASWFPFPDNSFLDWDRYGDVDLLYISHLHRDHFDPENLSEHVSHDATVLLPDYPTGDMERELRRLGFRDFRRIPDGEPVEHDGLSLLIMALTAPNDGAVGDSALAVDDGSACLLNQNDAKLTDFDDITAFGPYDIHFLQFSGANWWPWVYTLPEAAKRSFGAAKRANGLARALQFVHTVKARHIVPSAGPACFLDDELFHHNDLDSANSNTFPDHAVFLGHLDENGIEGGLLTVPGSVLELTRSGVTVIHPASEEEARRPFTDKRAYLRSYADRMHPRIAAERAAWSNPDIDVFAELKTWFEPLLVSADNISSGIDGPVLLNISGEAVVVDFNRREVRRHVDERCRYSFSIARTIMEKLITDHEVDWVNSLFLSLRFSASRIGPYNEFVYAFFTCLSPERIRYAESWYTTHRTSDEEIRFEDWWIPRWCPHRHADLERFGQLEGEILTCQMHGWRFDLPTGRCLTSAAHGIRSRRDGDEVTKHTEKRTAP